MRYHLQYNLPRFKLVFLCLFIGIALQFLHYAISAPSQLGQLEDPAGLGDLKGEDKSSGFSPMKMLGIDDWIAGRKRRILLIGSRNVLGQGILSPLLEGFAIHTLDVQPPPLAAAIPDSTHIHHYSQPESSITSLLSSNSYAGIIHLGGLSLQPDCKYDTKACGEIVARWTRELLGGLSRTSNGGWWRGKGPWVFFGSTLDISPDNTDPQYSTMGEIYASSETLLSDAVTANLVQNRVMIARFPTIYGAPIQNLSPDSFLHSLMMDSITSQHTQYDSDAPPLDLLHYEDAIDGLLRSVHRLESMSGESGLEALNFASGTLVHRAELVDRIRHLTSVKGPLRDIGTDQSTRTKWRSIERTTAENLLGWAPSVDLTDGLERSIIAIHQASADWAQKYLRQHCPNPAYSDRIAFTELQSNIRNRELGKLKDCTVNIAFDRDGYLDYVKCPARDDPDGGPACHVNNTKIPAFTWGASLFHIRAADSTDAGGDGRFRVKIEGKEGDGWLGFPLTGEPEGLSLVETESDAQTVFDLEVNEHDSSLRLLVGSDYQLTAMPNGSENSTIFNLVPLNHTEKPKYDMRLNVICCHSEGDWPLLLDDYETADIRFGTAAQVPFNSSRQPLLCQRAEESLQWNNDRIDRIKSRVSEQYKVELSIRPHDWIMKDLPPCWNDCSSPTICIKTGSCRCARAECPSIRQSPKEILDSLSPSSSSSSAAGGPGSDMDNSVLGSLQGPSPALIDAVSQRDWRDVLLPSFRAYLAHNSSYPSIHVVSGYVDEEKIESAPCHKLQTSHCFSADSILYRAMRHLSVPHEQAELIVIPVYQHCDGAGFELRRVIGHAMDSIPGVKEGTKKMVLALTHDWGICVSFAWDIWAARDQGVLHPDWILDNILVWSVMGDYDSPCYRPHQDTVIPARTCQSTILKDHFEDMANVVPVNERKKLVTWGGTFWGTGKSERLRLICDRGGARDRPLIEGGGGQSSWMNRHDYMKELSSARFCPQPRGIAGWSPRVSDAIYAGCIPVLSAEGTHYPWINQLDWTKFSVRILPHQLDSLEKILEAIPVEELERMQQNLMLVRDAFIYADDERPEDELDRRGPMFWALHAAGDRMGTQYASR